MTKCLLFVLVAVVAVTAKYDATLALTSWYYAKTSFCPTTELLNWTCLLCQSNFSKDGITGATVFDNATTGAQAFVLYNPTSNTIVVSFRGSDNLPNWIYDLDFFQIKYSDFDCSGPATMNATEKICKVHRGFLDVYHSVSVGLIKAVQSLYATYPNASVLVTGHSLGAAVSILAAVDLVKVLEKSSGPSLSLQLYNFGEPRVGNPAWAYWVHNSVFGSAEESSKVQYRVTHKHDPVPLIPLLQWDFLHTPHEVWYDNDLAGNNFRDCVDTYSLEDPLCIDSTGYDVNPLDHLLYLGVRSGCRL